MFSFVGQYHMEKWASICNHPYYISMEQTDRILKRTSIVHSIWMQQTSIVTRKTVQLLAESYNEAFIQYCRMLQTNLQRERCT
jgi:phage antirepressor YoqD-like protein